MRRKNFKKYAQNLYYLTASLLRSISLNAPLAKTSGLIAIEPRHDFVLTSFLLLSLKNVLISHIEFSKKLSACHSNGSTKFSFSAFSSRTSILEYTKFSITCSTPELTSSWAAYSKLFIQLA